MLWTPLWAAHTSAGSETTNQSRRQKLREELQLVAGD